MNSAQEIISSNGLAGVSAREIARRIGYSPGTLYNLFESLDDLLLHVEVRLLSALDSELSQIPINGAPEQQLRQLTHAYSGFCRQRPHLWNLIAQHTGPNGSPAPAWYLEKLEGVIQRVEAALAPLMPADQRDPVAVKRAATMLWAGVQGIISLSTTEKLSSLASWSLDEMVDKFVATYVAGLQKA